MKSKIYLVIIAVLTLVGCSNNDDNSVVIEDYGKLLLKLEQTNVTVGESVAFKVTNNKKELVNSNIFIDGKPALINHTFLKEGVFEVIAKRKGYEDSDVLRVNVGAKRLVLKAERTSIELSEYVSLSVLYNNKVVDEEVVIYNTKTNEPLDSQWFYPSEIGTYSFIAKAEGYSDSEEVVIEVKEPLNKFVFDGKSIKIDDFILIMRREEHIDKSGNSIFVDEIMELPDGRLANVYYFLFGKQMGEYWDVVFLDFYVVNSTVVKKDGKIVDYGVRALPKKGEDIIIKDAFIYADGKIADILHTDISSFTTVLSNLEIDKDGLFNDDYDYMDIDDDRYLNGKIDIEMKLVTPFAKLDVFYNSTTRFYDKVSSVVEVNRSSSKENTIKELKGLLRKK